MPEKTKLSQEDEVLLCEAIMQQFLAVQCLRVKSNLTPMTFRELAELCDGKKIEGLTEMTRTARRLAAEL